MNKGIGSFQELLQQQKDTLQRLQQDYCSYTELACVHPSVVIAHRESSGASAQERMLQSTRGIMRQVNYCACACACACDCELRFKPDTTCAMRLNFRCTAVRAHQPQPQAPNLFSAMAVTGI